MTTAIDNLASSKDRRSPAPAPAAARRARTPSLRLRLAVGLAFGMAAVLAAVLLAARLDLSTVLRVEASQRLRQVVDVALGVAGQDGPHFRFDARGVPPLDDAMLRETSRITGAIINVYRGGTLLATSHREETRAPDLALEAPVKQRAAEMAAAMGGSYFRDEVIEGDVWYVHFDAILDPDGSVAGLFVAFGPKVNFDAWSDAILARLALLGGIAAALVAAAFIWALRRVFRRFDRVRRALDALADGRMDVAVPSTADRDEVGSMARAAAAFQRAGQRLVAAEAAAEAAMAETEGLARFFHESPNPVLRLGASGLIHDANAAAAPVLAAWGSAVGGKAPAELQSETQAALASGETRSQDLEVGAACYEATMSPVPALGYVNLYCRDVTEQRRRAAEAQHLARHDPLTDLPNRRCFAHDLMQSIAAEARGAVAFVDLDHFKEVNDALGHHVGDQLLIAVAARLQAALPAGARLARLGGDEFAAELPGVADEAAALAVAERLIADVSRPFEIGLHRPQIGASVGVALYPRDGADAGALLVAADVAMYDAKAAGRGAARPFRPELLRRVEEGRQLTERLRAAVDEGRIEVHYQPKVDLASGQVIGAEALARWREPDLGWIGPDRFVPLAERSGLIGALGRHVLARACADAAAWTADPRVGPQVAVNLSALQLHDPRLVGCVAEILAATGLAPARLELEVTESAAMADADAAVARLEALRGLGLSLAIDDFGTGYSSLSQLRRFRASTLKIDRSFVADIASSADARAVAQAVVSLGRSLDMRVVAEGVETGAQAAALEEMGAQLGQGWRFGRPTDDDAFRALLATPAAA